MPKGCWKGAWPSWGQGFARSGKLIFSQCTLSPPSENIRKPSGFIGNKWVNNFFTFTEKIFNRKLHFCGILSIEESPS